MANQQKENILIALPDPQVSYLFERVLKSANYQVTPCADQVTLKQELMVGSPALMVMAEDFQNVSALELAGSIVRQYPNLPIVLVVNSERPDLIKAALRVGISDILCLPLRTDDVLKAVQHGLAQARTRREWVLLEARRATSSLQKQLNEFETLARLGRSITSLLNLDDVLSAVVDAAVELSGAEEGSLLLVDPLSGELYMRAARNFQDEFVRQFRLPIQDTLAGRVVSSGQPVVLDEQTPRKIKTAYLVQSLIYVPLQANGRVFGVLGVDNRGADHKRMGDRDVRLLMALAEFVVIAIQNAELYQNIAQERTKLGTILAHIQDGVIMINSDRQVIFINRIAEDALGLIDQPVVGKVFSAVLGQNELVDQIAILEKDEVSRIELTVKDGRVFSAVLAQIPEVGIAITMSDITNLKRLDRLKSEFVNTVSHDLRSPLTAILGYVELLDRVGTLNATQQDFVKRVQASVHNITNLVDELLNLGRIEAGFDARRESVRLEQLFRLSIESLQNRMTDRQQTLLVEVPDEMPPMMANPVQMRQVIDNLLGNAHKYTPDGGTITFRAGVKQNQIVFQVVDNGIGIPAVDLPYIFDKFYRASNSGSKSSGTGLGLAIVKTIVENHHGRIWVESTQGVGSTFTVLLPLSDKTGV